MAPIWASTASPRSTRSGTMACGLRINGATSAKAPPVRTSSGLFPSSRSASSAARSTRAAAACKAPSFIAARVVREKQAPLPCPASSRPLAYPVSPPQHAVDHQPRSRKDRAPQMPPLSVHKIERQRSAHTRNASRPPLRQAVGSNRHHEPINTQSPRIQVSSRNASSLSL